MGKIKEKLLQAMDHKVLSKGESLEYLENAVAFYERRVPGFDGVGKMAIKSLLDTKNREGN